MSDKKKRKASTESEKKTSKKVQVEKEQIDVDKEWDKIEAFFGQKYRKESDRIREGIEKEWKANNHERFENCPACYKPVKSKYRGKCSSLTCKQDHEWWPCEKRVLKPDENEKGCDERLYYGERIFQKMRAQQALAKAAVWKEQAQAMESIGQGRVPECIKDFVLNPFLHYG
jgi:hypothetical protein